MRAEVKRKWAEALTALEKLPEERRDHFAYVLTLLAECYTGQHRAALVFDDGACGTAAIIGVNATDMEVAGMLAVVTNGMMQVQIEDAPERGMYN